MQMGKRPQEGHPEGMSGWEAGWCGRWGSFRLMEAKISGNYQSKGVADSQSMTPPNTMVFLNASIVPLLKRFVQCYMLAASLKFLWGKALMHLVYLKNQTWTWYLQNTTLLEVLTGIKPDLLNMHPHGGARCGSMIPVAQSSMEGQRRASG